jgi:hypothetical protein
MKARKIPKNLFVLLDEMNDVIYTTVTRKDAKSEKDHLYPETHIEKYALVKKESK